MKIHIASSKCQQLRESVKIYCFYQQFVCEITLVIFLFIGDELN